MIQGQEYCSDFGFYPRRLLFSAKHTLDNLDDNLVRNGIIVTNCNQPNYFVNPDIPNNIGLIKQVIKREASSYGFNDVIVKSVNNTNCSPLKPGDNYYDTTGIVYHKDIFKQTEPKATTIAEAQKAQAEQAEKAKSIEKEPVIKDMASVIQEISTYCTNKGGPKGWCSEQANRVAAEGLGSSWSKKFLMDLETGNLPINSGVVASKPAVSMPTKARSRSRMSKPIIIGAGAALLSMIVFFAIKKKK